MRKNEVFIPNKELPALCPVPVDDISARHKAMEAQVKALLESKGIDTSDNARISMGQTAEGWTVWNEE